jgi:hypothetical protein
VLISHGPLNSWSRMGWMTLEASRTPSYDVLWNQVRHNMLVCGFSANQHGFAALDYDDGTEFMNSTSNVLVYSGFKACWHSNNQRYSDNLLIRPDLQSIDGRIKPEPCASCTAGAPTTGSYQANTGWMKNESISNNVCIQNDASPKVMYFGACASTSAHVLNGTGLYSFNNTYYGQFENFECGGHTYNLSGWQALWAELGLAKGGEYGSQIVAQLPSADETVAMARAKLLP